MKAETNTHRLTTICHHLIVPHQANHYHPHLIRRTGIAVVIFAVVAMQYVSANIFHNMSVLGLQSTVSSGQLLADTNKARTDQNLPSLTLNKQLSAAAAAKGADMLKHQYWAHISPQGVTPWQWIDDSKYVYSYAGENLAKNYPTSAATMAAWLASSEHRANILNTHYTDVGFAVVDGILDGQSTEIVVAMYARPAVTVGFPSVGILSTTAPPQSLSPSKQAEVVLQSIDPAAIMSTLVLLLFALSALLAHIHRHKIRVYRQQVVHHSHGALKAMGAVSVAVVIILMYAGGQL